MAKRREGLHKQISAIFDGVPIPKGDGAERAPRAPTPDGTGHVLPKLPAAPRQLTPSTAKPPQPAETPPTPKLREPGQSLPKAAPAKRAEADAAVKPKRQIRGRQIPQWQKSLEQIKTKLFTPKPGVSATRQKAIVILAPALFIVMIFVFIRVLSGPSPMTSMGQSFGPTNPVGGSDNKIDWQIPDPYPTTLRDPMQFGSVTVTEAGTSGLTVRAIVYSRDDPVALIGRRRVHEGDKVLGATIVKINEGSVEFEMNGKRWTQRVQQ